MNESAGADRPAYGWLRERDVDLLLCAELHGQGALERLFARRVCQGQASFIGAWVSQAEIEGESDVIIAWATPRGQVMALVENKIGAPFQPDQAERYLIRAEKAAAQMGVADAVTVLFAPEPYLEMPEAQLFDRRIDYDQAAEVLRSDGDRRAAFLADMLVAGAEMKRRGRVSEPDAAVSAVWRAIWECAVAEAPALRMARPAEKPGKSTWVYFKEAAGFGSADHGRAVVVLKADRGQADLQFADRAQADLEAAVRALGQAVPDGVVVEQAGKSASLRINVPPLDFRADPASQRDAISAGLAACEWLRRFYAQYKRNLIGS